MVEIKAATRYKLRNGTITGPLDWVDDETIANDDGGYWHDPISGHTWNLTGAWYDDDVKNERDIIEPYVPLVIEPYVPLVIKAGRRYITRIGISTNEVSWVKDAIFLYGGYWFDGNTKWYLDGRWYSDRPSDYDMIAEVEDSVETKAEPIVTIIEEVIVTKRALQNGLYGRVYVANNYYNSPAVGIQSQAHDDIPLLCNLTIDELEHAAKVFLEVAQFMREKKESK